MNDIFAKQIRENKIIVYMDDIMIYATSMRQLIANTLEVFDILTKHKLYVKPAKCQFHKTEVSFLGYIISEARIRTDPGKIQGILDWQTPKNLKEVRSFTGFTNFYRRFIKDYAKICRPLDQLKRKGIAFVWGKPQEEAFQTLKDLFSKKPLLMQADPEKPFFLETDASAVATGAVLRQLDSDGQLRPIGYISQALNPTQRNWQIYDRELYAIIRALQTWRHYLLGSPHVVTIHCDHKNLTYWRQPQRLTPRQARWQNELSRYNYKIQAVPGRHMIQSDALSRRSDHFKTEGELNADVTLLPDKIFIQEMEYLLAELEEAEDHDRKIIDLDKLHKQIQDETGDIQDAMTLLQKELPLSKPKMTEFSIKEKLIHFRNKILVPKSKEIMRNILRLYHDLPTRNHPGIANTMEQIRRTYYWPRMQQFITKYIQGCATCQQMKINRHPLSPPLNPIIADKDTYPFATVNIDFITDLPESDGYDSICVVVDHDCTKAIVLTPCVKTITALDTAQLYIDNVYRRFGLPRKIISDRGPQFASIVFKQLCRLLHINQAMSTAYHPQTDGQAERTNQEIEAYFRIYAVNHPNLWSKYIPLMEYTHNNRKHSVTDQTPFRLLMGYDPASFPSEKLDINDSNIPALQNRLEKITEIRRDAEAALLLAQEFQREAQNTTFKPLKEGQNVWLEAKNLRRIGLPSKFQSKREGPFTIKRKLRDNVYELDLPRSWKIHPVFHASLLTPNIETEEYGPAFSQPPPDLIDGEEEYEVEAILCHKGTKKNRRYYIKWLGYPSSKNTWEPEDALQNTQELLDDYKKLHHLD